MAEIENLDRLHAKLDAIVSRSERYAEADVAVGYTAASALFVHENMEMAWKGLSRDPRIRRIELGGDPDKAIVPPRPRKREPKGRYWDPQGRGQSKFLEAPARANRAKYARIVAEQMQRGRTLAQALLMAGLDLQRDSQLLVPVDQANLKASAFTRLESGESVPGGPI